MDSIDPGTHPIGPVENDVAGGVGGQALKAGQAGTFDQGFGLGNEFQLSSFGVPSQWVPKAAMSAGGNFVIVWE